MTPHFLSSLHNAEANRLAGMFASKLIWGVPDRFGPHCSVAVVDKGNLVAAVIFHNADEDAGIIELSGASISRRWATPTVLNFLYDVAFNLLGNQMVMQRVKSGNAVHLTQLRRLGFKEYVIERGAGRDEDLHIFTMTAEQWADHPLKRRALDRKTDSL